LLDKPVDHRRDTQLPFAPAGLGDVHPTHRFGFVTAVEQTLDERLFVPADPARQFFDAHAVHPRRALVGENFRIGLVQVVRTDHLFHQL
jgi:hypothetical protein